jgi:signal transduction histidine kinase
MDMKRDLVLAFVAHELRAPLAAIAGWAQLLQRLQLSDERARRAVEIIGRNAAAQGRLIDDLLDQSQLVRGALRLQLEAVDLVEVAAGATEAVHAVVDERGIALETLSDDTVPVKGDPGRLRQVFLNLLANAIRYSPDGSRVLLEIRRVERQGLVRVSDSGIGIAPSFLPFVFERFRRDERSLAGGLGLGLAIARDIVELHGGTIAAESAGEGHGATFTVCLPCADGALSATPPAA